MQRNRGPWSPDPDSPSAIARVSEGALWSSVYLDARTDLAGKSFCFFHIPLGQEGMDISDTNLRERGRIPAGVNFTVRHVAWTVLPLEGETDLEKLANAFGFPMVDSIKAHGTLAWVFLQTWIDIAPLWLDSTPQNLSIPGNLSFSVMLRFGKAAPTINLPHVIRLIAVGSYEHTIEIG